MSQRAIEVKDKFSNLSHYCFPQSLLYRLIYAFRHGIKREELVKG